MIARVALVVCIACARLAAADPEAEADAAFRDASARAVAGDAGALDAFEALGAARPITRWTDNAWSEAARLAERARDYARARHALEQVIATGTDDVLVRRARASLERLAATTGGGTWDAVAREHQRLVADVHDGGDPHDALTALERLVQANPTYPQATNVRLAIAHGWDVEGDWDRALRWYRAAVNAASGEMHRRAGFTLARAQIRHGSLDGARDTLDALAARPDADRATIADLRATLAAAETRAKVHVVMWIVLAVLFAAAAAFARRDAGSWRALGRLALRPPFEAVFLAPIATILVVVARTGNPLVADAVTIIAVGAVPITYASGIVLEAVRRRGPPSSIRIALHVLAVLLATAAVVYIAVDRDRVIDLIEETWEHGPEG